ncbi:MAG: hypothetical protein C0501_18365 [Isosphaera sp.]|nr:hypothetical protein [Isosphaera sp.]
MRDPVAIGRRLGHLLARGLTDADLLGRFTADRDEAAFAELVRRHGPAVLAACRRASADRQDAEDVFQATFLVLARKAAAVRRGAAVGGWLFAVAGRLAARVRADRRRRRADPLDRAADLPAPAPAGDPELRRVVDDELARLPARYRAALVLCYLSGRTREEAAADLGCSPGSVKKRLERGRELLRGRLARRGVTAPGVAVVLGVCGDEVRAAVPAGLAEGTARAAATYAHGVGAGGVVPAGVLSIANGGLNAMFLVKCKAWAGGLVLAAGLAAGGSAAWPTATAQAPAAQDGGTRPAAGQAADPARPAPAADVAALRARLAKLRDIEAASRAEGLDTGSVRKAIQDAEAALRAAEAVKPAPAADDATTAVLRKLLTHPDAEVRKLAAQLLERLPQGAGRPRAADPFAADPAGANAARFAADLAERERRVTAQVTAQIAELQRAIEELKKQLADLGPKR